MHPVATAFSAAAAVHAGAVLWAATRLPAQVPVHWAAGGAPDRYGTRAEFVLSAGAAGALVAALFVGLAALARRVPLGLVEVPHAEHWKHPDHEPVLRSRLAQDALWFGAVTLLVLAGCVVLAVRAVDAPQQRLSPLVVVLVGAYVASMAGRCVWIATRRYRPVPEDGPSARR